MGKLWISLTALALLAIGPAAADSDEPFLPGELEALRRTLAVELDGHDYQRVEVGRQLRTRRDSRASRRRALADLATQMAGVTPALIEAFVDRNSTRVDLWYDARRRLGQRAERNAFLVARPREVHVQFARAALDPTGRRLLVYLELRPFEGAPRGEGVFRLLERDEGSWRLTEDRHAFRYGGRQAP